MAETSARIAKLNDMMRDVLPLYGQVLITQGIRALPAATRAQIMGAVRTFDAFTKDNDPHHEHDFGQIDLDDIRVFWKIDYFAKPAPGEEPHTWGSEAPEDPRVTDRVLTVMLSEEY